MISAGALSACPLLIGVALVYKWLFRKLTASLFAS